MMQIGSFLMLMMLQFGVFHVPGLKKKQTKNKKQSAWLVLPNPGALLACVTPHGATLDDRQCMSRYTERGCARMFTVPGK